jgi:hypothetical protein
MGLGLLGGEAGTAGIVQKGALRVSFEGSLRPKRLPRVGHAPVSISLSGRIRTTDGSAPPHLRRLAIAINRQGRLDTRSLPRCHYHQIQPASTREALAACRRALVGTGIFEADVRLPEQSPFPSNGKVLAFNGVLHGEPVLYAHIYGPKPIPISQVIPFRIRRTPGTYHVALVARLPEVAAEWGYVSGLELTLGGTAAIRRRAQAYLSAGCPAPAGFSAAVFPLAHTTFAFDDGRSLGTTLTGVCHVR